MGSKTPDRPARRCAFTLVQAPSRGSRPPGQTALSVLGCPLASLRAASRTEITPGGLACDFSPGVASASLCALMRQVGVSQSRLRRLEPRHVGGQSPALSGVPLTLVMNCFCMMSNWGSLRAMLAMWNLRVSGLGNACASGPRLPRFCPVLVCTDGNTV